jgi:hypothetical protein
MRELTDVHFPEAERTRTPLGQGSTLSKIALTFQATCEI